MLAPLGGPFDFAPARLRPPYTRVVLPGRQRDAIPAAAITFITSAPMNQYKPKYAAFASECVKA
jgi:hypothetical protein